MLPMSNFVMNGTQYPHKDGLTVGSEVGNGRWPRQSAHYATWGKPYKGRILRPDDPKAWENTLAFPYREPTQEEATAHVLWCYATVLRNAGEESVAVEWDFGGDKRVFFERASTLRLYSEDFALWKLARCEKLRELRGVDSLRQMMREEGKPYQ